MNAFEDFRTEDIGHCAADEFASGILSRIYFADASALKKITLPLEPYTSKNFKIKKEDLEFQQFRGWSYFNALIEESELTDTFSGSARRKKKQSSLALYILGYTTENLRKFQNLINRPLIFLIIDANGQQFLFGNLRNYAQFEKVDGSTGKKYEDNSGFAASITTRTTIFPVEGDSTRLYVGGNYIWVLSDDITQGIQFNNNEFLQIYP